MKKHHKKSKKSKGHKDEDAVNEKNDTDPRRNESLPVGVKRINDTGVFTITASASVWAYIWLLIVLLDQNVEIWEAWITFGWPAVDGAKGIKE